MTSILYVGSYGSGISIFERTGSALTKIGEAASSDPSYLVADPGRGTLYAANERTEHAVSAFGIEPDGSLRPLGSQPTGGTAPCHLLVHPTGYLLTANYGSGSVSVHPIRPDGGLAERTDLAEHSGHGPDSDRQEGPHAHQVKLVSGIVGVVDLGLDRIVSYRLDADHGRLLRNAVPLARTRPGAGPRHAVAHPSGAWYLANELDSTLAYFQPDYDVGELRLVGSVPATGMAAGTRNQPAAIALSTDRRYVYLSNRGANTIATFELEDGGHPKPVGEVSTGGDWPRDFTIVDDLLLVANERSDTVTGFRLDPRTGLPAPLGELARTGSPTCLVPITLN